MNCVFLSAGCTTNLPIGDDKDTLELECVPFTATYWDYAYELPYNQPFEKSPHYAILGYVHTGQENN